MKPPKTFSLGISAMERRFRYLVGILPQGKGREEVLDGDKFEGFKEAAHRAVFLSVNAFLEDPLALPDLDSDAKDELRDEVVGVDPEALEPKGPTLKAAAVLDAFLRYYYQKTMTIEVRTELAWRVAAGWKHLRSGELLAPSFEFQYPPDWVGLRVEDVFYGRGFRTATGFRPTLDLVMRIVSGPYSGLVFRQTMPYKFVMYKLARDIGMPLHAPLDKTDLATCYFAGIFDPTGEYGPAVTTFYASESVKERNRGLYKKRLTPCERGYTWPCMKCTVGHGYAFSDPEAQCYRAVHQHQYIPRNCTNCGLDSWFDPSLHSAICVTCLKDKALSALKK